MSKAKESAAKIFAAVKIKLHFGKSWQNYVLSAGLGMLATLALPPFFLFFLLIPALAILLLQLDKCESRTQAFLTGWWFGFGHFVTGLYWISNSLLVNAKNFAWLIPFAVSLIPAALAVYTGLVVMVTYMTARKAWRKVVIFSGLWLVGEVLRAYLFTGFPWNLTGYSWNFSTYLIQAAAIWGAYGQSMLAVLFAGMFYVILKWENKNYLGLQISNKNILPLIMVSALVLLSGVFGYLRLNKETASERNLAVYLIQGNIKQEMKWDNKEQTKAVLKHLMLTHDATLRQNPADPSMVVWSETSVPYFIGQEPELQKAIGNELPENSMLITGALRSEKKGKQYDIWNSMFVIGPNGVILDHYDKFHLVPFGEYVPFRNVLWFINKITHGMGDFSRGSGNKTLNIGGLKISPLICYEVIFPGHAIDFNDPPDVIVNVTNDAWFGSSTGPYQHLEMARIRAVEQGIPLVRVANTGISAAFDFYGNQLADIPLNHAGYRKVSVNLGQQVTIFSRWNLSIILFMILISLGFSYFLTKN